MDILLIKTEVPLRAETLKRIHDDIAKQLESKVVIIPPYLHPEIVNVPDDIEVVVEPYEEKSEFLDKK